MASEGDSGTCYENITIRPVLVDDLPEINRLISPVTFDIGVHILGLYFTNSSPIWRVAVNEQNEMVAFESIHTLPLKGITFGFNMFVREDYRGKRIMQRLIPFMDRLPQVGNATTDALLRVSIPIFEKLDAKMVGYFGIPQVERDNGSDPCVTVGLLDEENDMNDLLNYDSSIMKIDRRRFTMEWCRNSSIGQPYSKTVVAKRDGLIVGFGTVRLFSDYYSLMPLYADDRSTAMKILNKLVQLFVQECAGELYMFFDASNRSMMEIAHRWKFQRCDTEIRHYCKGADEIKKHIRFDCVYVFHEYWPV